MPLEVNIRKKFDDFQLHMNFTAGDEVFAFLGASGSGKSMTCKCIAGIITPDEGRIVLNGRVLFDSKRKINLSPQQRRVGYMFQDYALFPNMTVLENVLCGFSGNEAAKHRGLKRGFRTEFKEKAEELLNRFQISDLSGKYPSELSGGQKQRCAMARIVAQEPEAVLLDEPFAALDSYLRWQLEAEMRTILSSMGKPVIFVSHSRDEVFHLADRVCALKDGQAEVVLEKRAFFENPGTRTAALISGCKNISKAERRGAKEVYASDWGISLVFRKLIPEKFDFIGIRAHYFSVSPEDGEHEFEIIRSSVTEDPFEWTVSFCASPEGSMIRWKLPKRNGVPLEIPRYLYVRDEDIMFLRK